MKEEYFLIDTITKAIEVEIYKSSFSANPYSQVKFYESDCVSILDVISVLNNKFIGDFDSKVKSVINDKFEKKQVDSITEKFDWNKNRLKINFYSKNYCTSNYCSQFIFDKKEKDLYISHSRGEFLDFNDILYLLGNEISNRYDLCLEYSKLLFEKDFHKIKSVNSKLYFDLFGADNGLLFGVFASIEGSAHTPDFFIQYNQLFKDCEVIVYRNNLNSNKIKNAFANIFVRIKDCPIWMNEDLNNIRDERLKEQKQIIYQNSSNIDKIKQLIKKK